MSSKGITYTPKINQKVLTFNVSGFSVCNCSQLKSVGERLRNKSTGTGRPRGMLWCPLNTGSPLNTGFDR